MMFLKKKINHNLPSIKDNYYSKALKELNDKKVDYQLSKSNFLGGRSIYIEIGRVKNTRQCIRISTHKNKFTNTSNNWEIFYNEDDKFNKKVFWRRIEETQKEVENYIMLNSPEKKHKLIITRELQELYDEEYKSTADIIGLDRLNDIIGKNKAWSKTGLQGKINQLKSWRGE